MILGRSSFRRILVSRLLLVSVPVLLMGVYVTYRKARSAFLETARQNLTESAIRKGQSISQSIESLQANLVTASDSVVLKEGSQQDQNNFLKQLSTTLPTQIQCIQLQDLSTGKLTASTCDQRIGNPIKVSNWSQQQTQLLTNPDAIFIDLLLPNQLSKQPSSESQLVLFLAAPVYDSQGGLRYALKIQSALLEKEKVSPGSLAGYPVVIAQSGTILAHPFRQRVGRNIEQEADANRLKILIGNAIAGRQDFLHLFALEKDGVELVAGYSSIPSPVTQDKGQKWVILAVSPLVDALSPLVEIRRVLFYMVFALLTASFLAVLYIAWELARPVEKLRDYAINKANLNAKQPMRLNFRIREVDQLAIAIQDMVERLQAWGEEVVSAWQEAQNANRLKSEFLATTSHELRTPLNGIIGCLHILKEGYCDSKEEELEFLQQAEQAAVHLLGIIDDVLDLAKIEAGKLSVSLEPVDLTSLLSEVINLQTITLQKKRLTLMTKINPHSIIVQADPKKLKQVILNVLGNAIKFTEKGNITIKTHIEENNHQKQVCITVKDTGIGIDIKQQDKLFRPFVMVDGSTTRKYSGTGLGLAISRNLMQLMGGNITLSSEGIDLGTTVKICLPYSDNLGQ
ncbi:histidine kinase [Rippkaea orientalis PCC 8801]|uniref:Circadian input-output histidine kinase CikA n=1 Tax=Rippkaea orientalis (strain PCC 8801 / RF-1) TaxID=41431 RepID=B7K5J2_RIPO1|nr:ATP-binding protein [Rippkaea orientalis]ACK66725.1 histidine kinase [Rippkaea orientalis PCC 8801]